LEQTQAGFLFARAFEAFVNRIRGEQKEELKNRVHAADTRPANIERRECLQESRDQTDANMTKHSRRDEENERDAQHAENGAGKTRAKFTHAKKRKRVGNQLGEEQAAIIRQARRKHCAVAFQQRLRGDNVIHFVDPKTLPVQIRQSQIRAADDHAKKNQANKTFRSPIQ